jgi:hypothetical protein
MPYYKVTRRQDAWIYHKGYVEADSPEAAAQAALDAWKRDYPLDVPLKRAGLADQFDDFECDAEDDDVEEVDEEEFREAVAKYEASKSASSTAKADLNEAVSVMLAALINVRSLIAEAAAEGFNWQNGDWVERLFASQQVTSAAIAKAKVTRS